MPERPVYPLTLYFMRHAHSVSQEDRSIVIGRAASRPLSAEGRRQAESAAKSAHLLGATRVYASTCVRALQTASFMGRAFQMPVIVDELLIERSHGELDGRKKTEAYTPELVAEIHADQLHWRPAGGESLADVEERIKRFLSKIAVSPPEGPCLIVTHLMVLWALFHLCTQCSHAILPFLHVDNAGLVEVEMHSLDSLRLIRWNRPFI